MVARTISMRNYTHERAAIELRQLLYEPKYQSRASDVKQQMQREDGSKTACDAVEKLLHRVSAHGNRRQMFTG